MTRAEHIKDQAARWLVRNESGATPEELAEFQFWLRADPRHRAAYLRLKAAWRRADILKRLRPLDGLVDADLITPPEAARASHWPGWRAVAATLAVAALAFVGWKMLDAARWQSYRTEVGGLSRVILEDGSRVDLNTDTAIRVRFGSGRRQVVLVRGEAQFTVARDTHRPFDVRAGDTMVRALGTSFSVRLRNGRHVDVVVTHGRVAVDPKLEHIGIGDVPVPSMTLVAGEAATVQPSGMQVDRLAAADLSRRLAWTGGWIIFDGETLAEAVAEFNRYNRQQLMIADTALSDLRVGGRFQATDPESFVAALESMPGVRAIAKGDRIQIHGMPFHSSGSPVTDAASP